MTSLGCSGRKLQAIGSFAIRFSLVAVLLWVGALKFTAYEAEGIQPLVSNSPLMAWGYQLFDVRGFARVLGMIEIVTAVLIALYKIAPRLSAIGSCAAIFMFMVTLSFVVTTPGAWQPGYGFPFPSPMPGQFVLKDVVLLAVAIWTAGQSLTSTRRQSAMS